MNHRLIFGHEEIGSEIIEILIIFTHSAHPEISKLSIQVIKQITLIKCKLIFILLWPRANCHRFVVISRTF